MNQNLVDQYKIVFQNQILKYDGYPAEIYKVPFSVDYPLSSFLSELYAEEINEILLPDINDALATPNSEIENESRTINILIYQDRVEFYDDYDENVVIYSIPTQDLKEILIGWRDFLLAPPLNGTKGWHNFGPNCVLIDHSTKPVQPIKTPEIIENKIPDDEFKMYSKQNKLAFIIWTIVFVLFFLFCILLPSLISDSRIIPISIVGVIGVSYTGFNALLYYKSWERSFIERKIKPEFNLDTYFILCIFPSIIFYYIIYWNFIDGSGGPNLHGVSRQIKFIKSLFP